MLESGKNVKTAIGNPKCTMDGYWIRHQNHRTFTKFFILKMKYNCFKYRRTCISFGIIEHYSHILKCSIDPFKSIWTLLSNSHLNYCIPCITNDILHSELGT